MSKQSCAAPLDIITDYTDYRLQKLAEALIGVWHQCYEFTEFTGVTEECFLSFSQDKGHQVGTEGNMESVRSQGSDKHRCMILPLREDSTESTT